MFNLNDLKAEVEAPVVEIDSFGSDKNTYPVAPASQSRAGSISSSSLGVFFWKDHLTVPQKLARFSANMISGVRPRRGISL